MALVFPDHDCRLCRGDLPYVSIVESSQPTKGERLLEQSGYRGARSWSGQTIREIHCATVSGATNWYSELLPPLLGTPFPEYNVIAKGLNRRATQSISRYMRPLTFTAPSFATTS